MNKFILVFIISFCFFGCSKMQEKKTSEESKTPSQNTESSSGQDNTSQMQNKTSGQEDDKASELTKAADDAIAKYSAEKSEANKKEVVTKCLSAANYLEFEANLPAREKYRPALKYYRKVLELDPKNAEAEKNKTEIENIYKQMGMPVPQ
jgi:tetratricopeptide (TPR) repeat protein